MLEYLAARWLKWERGCKLVLRERTPRILHGQPDVLGVTPARFLLEIEIKRSVSDFRANAQKFHIVNRFSNNPEVAERFTRKAPKHFWFLVPPALVGKVKDDVPPYAGLMTVGDRGCFVVKSAPTNNLSEKLTLKECATLMNNAGNQIVALMSGIAAYQSAKVLDDFLMDDFHHQTQPGSYVNYQI